MSSVKRAGDAMNASLRREFKRIESLLRSAPESVEVRHKVGRLVVAMKRDPERYGKQAVALVATALGRDEATLYRFAQVATRWTEDEVAQLVARAKAKSQPLTWWHFVEASAVSRKRDRDELIRRAVDEGLSVRAVARLAARSGRAARTTGQLVREAESLTRRIAVLREHCANLRAMDADDIDRTRSAMARVVAEAERARAEIETIAENAAAGGVVGAAPNQAVES